MSERKTSQTKLNTNREYHDKMDDIKLRVPKGYRRKISDYCKEVYGTSLNQVVISLLNADIQSHGIDLHIPSGRQEVKNSGDDPEANGK